MAISYNSNANLAICLNIDKASPIDNRMVVDSVDDLITFAKPYVGMIVSIKGTSDVYILTSGGRNAKNLSYWKKIGGSDINPSDFGAKVVTDVDSITDPYEGQFAIVNTDSSDSDNENGLYVYHSNSWIKVSITGSSTPESNSIITTDGTEPTTGKGFSINPNDDEAYIEEVYLDNTTEVLSANVYYTGRGFSSSIKGGNLDENSCSSIGLSNEPGSYIEFYAYDDSSDSEVNNWIKLHIEDDSLGFSKSDVHYVENGVDKVMENDDLILPCESTIKFDKDIDLRGMIETRGKDGAPTHFGLIFGDTGSTYADLDIYVSNVLPTVYAYVGDSSVKVLTEGDKVEIINMVENGPTSISDEEIENLFE